MSELFHELPSRYNVYVPSNSHAEILTPNVMVLRGQAFGRCGSHEDGALMNGISTLIKATPESSLAPSAPWRHSKMAVYDQEACLHQSVVFRRHLVSGVCCYSGLRRLRHMASA